MARRSSDCPTCLKGGSVDCLYQMYKEVVVELFQNIYRDTKAKGIKSGSTLFKLEPEIM